MINKYKFSLLYTTARPKLIPSVIARWLTSLHNSELEIIIVTDSEYEDYYVYKSVNFFINNGNKDCVTGWNMCAKYASGDILIQISDDLFPPDNWDYLIIQTILLNGGVTQKLVLNLLDERKCRDAVYHPVLTRYCYMATGYLYPYDFQSMFCDNWFFLFHSKYSILIESNEVFWIHKHRVTYSDVLVDEVTLNHESQSRYHKGKETLIKYVALQNL
jgi:glycosyltransferase involved in cell wall biosynthesis